MKVKITNAVIVDGTGDSRFQGEILVKDQRIIKISKSIDEDADEIINANGHIVCPGFIDTHSHSGLKIFSEPFMKEKIFQGVTTEIIGQDGISVAPVLKSDIALWKNNVEEIEGLDDKVDWNVDNVKKYLINIQNSKTSVNFGYLVPHGNIRMQVLGLSNKTANEKDLIKMKEILIRELENGAIGMSTGLIYSPCSFSDKNELIELCKVVAEKDGVFAVHQRSEANEIIVSMEEIIDVARKSGVKLHISHFKICGKKNWSKLGKIFELMDKAKDENIRISFDQYPYTAGCTSLGVCLPPWVHEGGTEKLIARLKDENLRNQIKNEILETDSKWDNFVEFAGFDGIYITRAKNSNYIGKNLMEIGEYLNKSPLDAMLDILIEERNNAGMIDYYGNEETLGKLMKREEQNFCTDGVLENPPHPRAYGSYPRVIRKYVREEKLLTLEEAIYKMTKKPAEVFSIKDRGVIKEGYFADLVIFDENKIKDNATFLEPCNLPEGIEKVIINGTVVIDKHRHLEKATGKIVNFY